MPDLSIPQHILDQIVAHARELAPFECCGLLAGTNKTVTHLYRITNIVAVEGAEKLSTFDDDKVAHLERLSPEERAEIAFVMDMGDFSAAKKDIRKNGLDLQVVYHSHPKDPARPSHTDIKIATDYEEIWVEDAERRSISQHLDELLASGAVVADDSRHFHRR